MESAILGVTMLQPFLLLVACTPALLLLALVLWFGRCRTAAGILAVAAVAGTMSLAEARDDGRYAQSPNREWFRSLTNQYGIMCCEGADGTSLDDPDWEFSGDGYRVRIEGNWMQVPAQAIVRQQNKMGHAMVWLWQDDGQWRIGCFMPGTGT